MSYFNIINIGTDGKTQHSSISLMQNDFGFSLPVRIIDKNGIYDIPDDAQAEVIWLKGDNKQVHNQAEIDYQNNIVNVSITHEMTCYPGDIRFNIKLSGLGWQKSTGLIIGKIEKNPHDDSNVSSSDQFSILDAILIRATEAFSKVELAEEKAEYAESISNSALEKSNQAKDTADIALSTANTAKETINSTLDTASEAKSTADIALSAANTAKETINSTLDTASEAKSTADIALSAANTAKENSNSSVIIANEAKDTADIALSKAGTALTNANDAANAAEVASNKIPDITTAYNSALQAIADANAAAERAVQAAENLEDIINGGNSIDDSVVSQSSTYSSYKIFEELNKKVEYTDIVDNLETNESNKPASSALTYKLSQDLNTLEEDLSLVNINLNGSFYITDANSIGIYLQKVTSRYNANTLNTPYTDGLTVNTSGGFIETYLISASYGIQIAYVCGTVNGNPMTCIRTLGNGVWTSWRIDNAFHLDTLSTSDYLTIGTVVSWTSNTIRKNNRTVYFNTTVTFPSISTTATQIMTLPERFKPIQNNVYNVFTNTGIKCELFVLSTGVVQIKAVSEVTVSTYVIFSFSYITNSY